MESHKKYTSSSSSSNICFLIPFLLHSKLKSESENWNYDVKMCISKRKYKEYKRKPDKFE